MPVLVVAGVSTAAGDGAVVGAVVGDGAVVGVGAGSCADELAVAKRMSKHTTASLGEQLIRIISSPGRSGVLIQTYLGS